MATEDKKQRWQIKRQSTDKKFEGIFLKKNSKEYCKRYQTCSKQAGHKTDEGYQSNNFKED